MLSCTLLTKIQPSSPSFYICQPSSPSTYFYKLSSPWSFYFSSHITLILWDYGLSHNLTSKLHCIYMYCSTNFNEQQALLVSHYGSEMVCGTIYFTCVAAEPLFNLSYSSIESVTGKHGLSVQ